MGPPRSAAWGMDGAACHAALRVASHKEEASLLCGLLAGALGTSARVCGRGLRTASTCPFCGAAHEDEAHVLWDRPRWHGARDSWSPRLLAAAADLPDLNPPEHWPACLQRAGLLPSRVSEGVDKALVDMFLYRLYGMYLAVLAERMATCHDGQDRPGIRLFPRAPQQGKHGRYPWADLCGPWGDVSSLLYATPPPSRSGPKAPKGGGGGSGRGDGGGGRLGGSVGGGGSRWADLGW